MTTAFVDTSGLLALINPDDEQHGRASRVFNRLRAQGAAMVTTSYVLVETYALIGRRFGVDTVAAFRADFAPLVDVVWVDEELHHAGLDRLVSRRRRQLSLVDAVSFEVMRARGLDHVFAFDPHFEQEGFEVLR